MQKSKIKKIDQVCIRRRSKRASLIFNFLIFDFAKGQFALCINSAKFVEIEK